MDPQTFSDRRKSLRSAISDGAILILGNTYLAKNYLDNHFPLRQDSHFLYYVGVSQPNMALVIFPDGTETLYGERSTLDDLVWTGPVPSLEDYAGGAEISRTQDIGELAAEVASLRRGGSSVHYLPPYTGHRQIWLAELLEEDVAAVAEGASAALIRQCVAQRSLKDDAETAEIENALGVTAAMYEAALRTLKPGATELEVVTAMTTVPMSRGRDFSFQPIVSVRGEILHNHGYSNTLADGDLLLIDSGANSEAMYASDITRTFPVNGKLSDQQRDIYEIVLQAQTAAIAACSPKVNNRDLHMVAVRTIASGLNSLGLMTGNVDEAVSAGAHALFMPHGIGHMMGLDVHDMEDLGDVVGYPEGERRSSQFGLSFLRLAKPLEPGFVITIEPGIYFNFELIDQWKDEGKFREFVAYEKLEAYRGFGGIRIEDDILVTDHGARVLGPGIPKTVEEIESALG